MPYTPLQLAEAFIQTGELPDAVATIKNHLNAEPLDANARRLLASVLMRLSGTENLEEAQRLLEGLHTLHTAEDFILLGMIYEQLIEQEPAITEFYKAWNYNRRDERIAEMYIERLRGSNSHHLIGSAMSVVLHMPRTWRWLQWAGDLSVDLSAYSWALMYYNEALADLERQFDTQNNAFSANLKANLLLKRANAYAEMKELDAADADYLAAQSIIPTDSMISFKRGLLMALRGDLQQAKSVCQSAWINASENLRDAMRRALQEDERLVPLAALLNLPTS